MLAPFAHRFSLLERPVRLLGDSKPAVPHNFRLSDLKILGTEDSL